MAAWKELAERSGRDVDVVRERLSDASLPPEGTVVMLDPEEFTRSEARTLRRFAEDGGRVIAGGAEPGAWIDEFGARLDWARLGREDARVLAPAAETGAARRLRTAGEGHWAAVSGAQPIVADADGRPLVVVRRSRRRHASCSSPTRRRCRTDCSTRPTTPRFALALAGDGPLVFLEEPHGYGEATGLAALPDRFKWALIMLCLAALLLIVARWPRLGPPDPVGRAAVPAAPRVRRRAGGHAGQDARPQRRGRVRTLRRTRAAGAARRTRARRRRRGAGTRRPARPGSATKRQGHCRT